MTSKSGRAERVPADRLPVARVCVDVPLPHLDRPFDYLVAAADDEAAQPGVRVKVRFAGQLVGGFLLERIASSPHGGKLAYLDKVVSPEQVLDPEVARLARAVADRYAGNLCDVLRLAVPPRHARVESQARPDLTAQPDSTAQPETTGKPVTPAIPEAVTGILPAQALLGHASAPETPAEARAATAHEITTHQITTAPGHPPEAGVTTTHQITTAPGHPPEAGVTTTHQLAVEANAIAGDGTRTASGSATEASAGSEAGTAAGANAGTGPGAKASTSTEARTRTETSAGTEAGTAAGVSASTEAGAVAAARAGSEAGTAAAVGSGTEAGTPTDVTGVADARILAGGQVTAAPRIGGAGEAVGAAGWGSYVAGPAFLRALEEGRPARAVWAALPGEDWAARLAEAAAATVRGGRGVVIVVADARDLDRIDRALGRALGEGRHVALNAALGPAERYRRFLAASRHRVAVVAGTRAAMWAPVAKLGLVVIWDDGDDLHAEPRSPYPHAREVLLTRAGLGDCAALVAGFARTGEGQLLLETGWAREIVAARDVLRARAPAIAPTGDDPQLARDPGAATARLPSLAWQTARQALKAGAPVLVQVPRRGYLPSVACAECRTPARCPHCSGPLALGGARDVPACRWCGRAAAAYSCPACGGRRLRASVTGARRTAEELGRAFPDIPVRTSGRDEILDVVPAEPAVVVATPGAEPVADGGYGAVLLLDAWALLTRSDLRAAEETMRRWLNAAALARPAKAGGRVVVVADGSLPTVQALLRWNPGWFAGRELAERRELSFPPAARFASLTGKPEAIAELLAAARLPEVAEVLGPVPAEDDEERMLIRTSRSRAAETAHALHAAAAVRSAKKSALPVRIEVDPATLF